MYFFWRRFTPLLAIISSLLLLTRAVTPAEAQKSKMVLGFYYAWYDPTSFGPGITPFQPIHPYFSVSEETIRRQVKTAKAAGLDGFVQSWYGPNPDQQTEPNLKKLLNIAQEHGFKVAVHFEVMSPFFGGQQDRIDALKVLIHSHAKHPAYLKLDGKPVIFFWANWALSLRDWRYIREQADPWNNSIWMAEGGRMEYLEIFDGMHLYNVAWSASPGGVNVGIAEKTRAAAETYGTYKYWAGTAMPGFDNSLVPGVEHTTRPRNNGRYLRDSFQGAASTNPDLLLVTSFNEWREGSQIEPSKELGDSYVKQLAQLSAEYKGISASSFPALPAWVAPAPTPTPIPPTPLPPTATPPLPSSSNNGNPNSQAPTATTTSPTAGASASGANYYIVQGGDTLYGIALKHNTTLEKLLQLNNMTANAILQVGQKLLVGGELVATPPPPPPPTPTATAQAIAQVTAVPQPTPTTEVVPEGSESLEPTPLTPPPSAEQTATPANSLPPADENGVVRYEVQEGDSFYGIANRFALPVEQIYQLNGLNQAAILRVGQTLILAESAEPVAEAGSAESDPFAERFADAELQEGQYLHKVQSGETLTSIAVRYGYTTMAEFYEVSGVDPQTFLQPGQLIIVGVRPEPEEVGGSADLPTATSSPVPTVALATTTPAPTRQHLVAPVPTNTLPPPPQDGLLAPESAELNELDEETPRLPATELESDSEVAQLPTATAQSLPTSPATTGNDRNRLALAVITLASGVILFLLALLLLRKR